ncbi:MAG: GntR family transcriptional regulator [Desulfohalobiaceae bacterium]|nr:GntR family transcriptional regulator [Desulfohalobiaceae bacterium]
MRLHHETKTERAQSAGYGAASPTSSCSQKVLKMPITNATGQIDITNINEKIYNLIKSRITRFEYPPGSQINVRQLQEELGVSNSPIKAALSRLAGEDLVEITSRKGTFVKDISKEDLEEIEEVREKLELGAAEIVAERISDEQLKVLQEKYEATLIPDNRFEYSDFMQKDGEFHLEIIKLTRNRKLVDIYKQLNSHVQIVRFQKARSRKKPLPWTNQDHLEILNALKSRDAERTRKAIREHRTKAREAFLADSDPEQEQQTKEQI